MEYNLPKITSAMLVLTHACNLKCRYCFVHQEPSKMTYQTAFDAVQFLIKNAKETGDKPSINFFGGEPMLMWDEIIVPLVTWIRQEYKEPFSIGITTNGTLLGPASLEFMKENDMNLLLSIDGAKETQDYNRPFHSGKGTFDNLENKLPLIIKTFPRTTFRSTVIPNTVEYLFDNIMFAEQSGFSNFFIVPNVYEEWSQEKLQLLSLEFRKYSNYIIQRFRESKTYITFSELHKSFGNIKAINIAKRKNVYRTFPNCQACGKCGLGSGKYVSVHPNGNIYGCQELTSNVGEENIFYIGNIYTGIIDQNRINLIKEFDNNQCCSNKYDCEECLLNPICDGGCVANNYLITGFIYKTPEMHCWWQQFLLNEAIYIMQTLGNEENELFKQYWEKEIKINE